MYNEKQSKPFAEKPKRVRTRPVKDYFEVFVFSSKEDETWYEAEALVIRMKELNRAPVKLINKLGFILPDLTLVAQHFIVKTPTVLMLRDEQVVFRQAGELTKFEVLKELLPV